MDLALAMSDAGALWLAGALLMTGRTSSADIKPGGCLIIVAGAVLAAFGNVLYFELQCSGDIVSFSQIGYVGAGLGLAGGSIVLGERYAGATRLSTALPVSAC